MGSDWDDESADEVTLSTQQVKISNSIKPSKSKWAEEDEEDGGVKDDWDASDEGPSKPLAAGPAPPVRKKGITRQKIAEKEALDRAKAEKQAALLAEENDPQAKQRAAREREMKADLENARGLFGDDAVEAAAPSNDPLESDPHTLTEFTEVSTKLAELIISKWGQKPLFSKFVEEHVKALCQPLKDIDVRAAASKLTTLANEKQKAAKTATGAGKKTKAAGKPQLGVGKSAGSRAMDLSAYEDFDDDEFM